jgi:hypothetical protein
MTHAERLHRRLLVALLLVPAGEGCVPSSRPAGTPADPSPSSGAAAPSSSSGAEPPVNDSGTGEPVIAEPVAKTTIDPRYLDPPQPTPTPTPIAPDTRPRATCPSGQWCGVVDPPDTGEGAVLGCPPSVNPRVKPIDPAKPDGPGGPRTSFDIEVTKAKRAAGIGNACCYDWVIPCPGGRALRDGDGAVQASFTDVAPRRVAGRTPHPEAAAAWLSDAGFEYTSVASFARAALELMAVGAPAELIRDCHLAALDELRHAEVCAEIAWSLGAAPVVPRVVPALAPREASWVRIAVDTFLEGCVGETLAALVLRAAAAECPDLELRAAIEAIAEDEERHAALAWRTLRVALERGGGGRGLARGCRRREAGARSSGPRRPRGRGAAPLRSPGRARAGAAAAPRVVRRHRPAAAPGGRRARLHGHDRLLARPPPRLTTAAASATTVRRRRPEPLTARS